MVRSCVAPAQSRSGRTAARFAVVVALAALLLPSAVAAAGPTGTYRNPLSIAIPGDGRVESCADPTVIEGQKGERDPATGELLWFMYCTTDPLNDGDRDAAGGLRFHMIPISSGRWKSPTTSWTSIAIRLPRSPSSGAFE